MNKQPKYKSTSIVCLVGCLLVMGLATTSPAATTEANLSRTFNVSPGRNLAIESDRGRIDIATSDRNDLVVEVRRKVTKASESDAKQILDAHVVTFEQDGNRLVIRGKFKEGFRQWTRNGAQNFEVEYKVAAPAKFNYDLRTAAGSISSGDIDGEVKARTSGGSLKFAAVTGRFDASTSAGGIRAGEVSGPVAAVTSGGSIQIDGLGTGGKLETAAGSITVGASKGKLSARTSGGSVHVGTFEGSAQLGTSAGSINVKEGRGPLKAVTSGGSITIEAAHDTVEAETSAGGITAAFASQPTDDCKLSTSGGSINVKLDPELSFDLDAKTSGGRITTEIPVAATLTGSPPAGALKGKLNAGGKALVLRTSAGGITIKRK